MWETNNTTPEIQAALAEYSLTKKNDDYKVYKVRTGRKGKLRTIEEPKEYLKIIQRRLVQEFEKVPLSSACMSRKGYSIATNAAVHANARYLLRVDIKNCYPSIRYDKVAEIYIKYLEIHDGDIAYLPCCFFKDHLPTGAPTSPILCNIALTPLDESLLDLAKEYGYNYTRYVDDLHFSTNNIKRDWNLLNKVKTIVKQHGFVPHYRKSNWMTVGHKDHVKVTGVMIGRETKVPVEFKRMIRSKLQNLAKKGEGINSEAQGCLAYIKSIDPEKYEDLMAYYNKRLNYALEDNGQNNG